MYPVNVLDFILFISFLDKGMLNFGSFNLTSPDDRKKKQQNNPWSVHVGSASQSQAPWPPPPLVHQYSSATLFKTISHKKQQKSRGLKSQGFTGVFPHSKVDF